ncbi:uncharacterized protein LOC120339383 [Styela clava]
MRFSVISVVIVWMSYIVCGLKYESKRSKALRLPLNNNNKDRFQLLMLLAYGSSHYMKNIELNKVDEISILTWNVLAPIWVEEEKLKKTGIVDMNLLDINMRLKLIAHEILRIDADIVTLQETQDDTHRIISRAIRDVYSEIPHTAHGKEHWKEYVERSDTYVKNGISTFYKRSKFVVLSAEEVLLSDNKNFALGVVFRMKKMSHQKESLIGPPITVMNCHLQHNAELKDALLRRRQVHRMVEWVTKQYNEHEKNLHGKPLTFLSGDFNTDTGYPAWQYLTSLGYVDAKTALNVPDNILSLFYATPHVSKALNRTFDGIFLDRVFARKDDIESGRVDFKSLTIPNILAGDREEAEHHLRALDILFKNLGDEKANFRKDVSSFLKLMSSLSDGSEYNQNLNRALRSGSDHLPVTVTFNLKN